MYFCAPTEGDPHSNWVPTLWVIKLESWNDRATGLRKKFEYIFMKQYTNVTDRQMDGRTSGDSKDRAYA